MCVVRGACVSVREQKNVSPSETKRKSSSLLIDRDINKFLPVRSFGLLVTTGRQEKGCIFSRKKKKKSHWPGRKRERFLVVCHTSAPSFLVVFSSHTIHSDMPSKAEDILTGFRV